MRSKKSSASGRFIKRLASERLARKSFAFSPRAIRIVFSALVNSPALSAAEIEADADTSLADFFKDFSVSPLREERPAVKPPNRGGDLELLPDDEAGDPPKLERAEQALPAVLATNCYIDQPRCARLM